MAYNPNNPNGQATMANSAPVVIASDQSTVPVSASSLPLPTGAATAAKQPALGTAGTASTDVITVQGITGATPQPVSGASTGSAVPSTAFYMGGNLAGNLTGTTIIAPADGQATQNGLYATSANMVRDRNAGSWSLQSSVFNGLNTAGTGIAASGLAAQFDDVSPTTITENNFGLVRISANRNLYSTIRDAAGNERGVNVTAGNALTVDGSATTQPISGTVAATQSGTWSVRNQDGSGNSLTSTNGSLNVVQQAPTGTLTNVNSSATNVTILASNTSRKAATIYNDSTQILYLKFGTTASTTSFTAPLAAATYYEVPGGYTGNIDGIWASANGAARITEIT